MEVAPIPRWLGIFSITAGCSMKAMRMRRREDLMRSVTLASRSTGTTLIRVHPIMRRPGHGSLTQIPGSNRETSCPRVRNRYVRTAVVTGVLNPRGLLNRDSESFGPFLWPPVVTPTFPFGPQRLSLEPEKIGQAAETAETRCPRPDSAKPRGLSLSGFCVNWITANGPRFSFGSPFPPNPEPLSTLTAAPLPG